ncbi:iron-sulfur cluster repair di-iron protein [Bacillus sp. 2205SS5-2]|uniref:iron-sulfur cluster repair di-iron protein n=1 Tax=Bacillus sp. 2205SS5-2 TaxID=3109031 RepID=UPI003005C1CE
MMQTFTEQSIISEIVTKIPRASDLFKSYQINFCCDGNRPLIEAINEKGLPSDEVLSQLNKLYEKTQIEESYTDWAKASSEKLINHIISKHHRYLKEELPLLSPYITKVSRVHGPSQPHLIRIHSLFFELKKELEKHILKEETIDFPAILAYENNHSKEYRESYINTVTELEIEHSQAISILKELRKLTNDFTPPEGACGTYRLVYQRLYDLESDLTQHIHLENTFLFNRVNP